MPLRMHAPIMPGTRLAVPDVRIARALISTVAVPRAAWYAVRLVLRPGLLLLLGLPRRWRWGRSLDGGGILELIGAPGGGGEEGAGDEHAD